MIENERIACNENRPAISHNRPASEPGRLSAKELADRFEVSSKTIYRDMDTLCQAGIRLRPTREYPAGLKLWIDKYWLSAEEMSALVTAVKGMSSALEDQQMGILQGRAGAWR